MGGGAKSNLSKKESLLFKDIKEFNRYLLTMVGIFIITLSGTISYYVNTSYAAWNSVSYSEETFEFSVSVPTGIEISTPPTKTEYKEGETFDLTGMVVQQVYSSGRKVVIEDFEISPSGELTENDTTITISYGDFSTTQNIIVIKPNLDTSLANRPALLSNMLPVYYDGNTWRKADSKNSNETYQWYDYNEKKWANAVTVDAANRQTYIDAQPGTEIPMSDINTMWVWIPRYTYTYFNDGTNTPKEIQISFEEGTGSNGTITCTDDVRGTSNGTSSGTKYTTSQTCTDKNTGTLVAGQSTYTHPAFNFGGTPLKGFWMGKFENSATANIPTSASTEEHTLIIKPDVQSLRWKAVSYFFKDIRQMEKYNNIYGFEQPSTTSFNWTGELTGDTNNIDTHMLKNIEWGAVVYLSHSKYGINKEININNSSDYYTGRSGGAVGGEVATQKDFYGRALTTSTNKYNNYGYYTYDGYKLNYGTNTKSTDKDLSIIASTTGNVYGVYDMSGASEDYVMGNMVNTSSQFYPSSARQWNSTTTTPLAKYYDSYTYNINAAIYTRGRLGDATAEMAPTGVNGNWYSEYASNVGSTEPWFARGGYFSTASNTGAFNFVGVSGTYSNGFGSRSALVVLN